MKLYEVTTVELTTTKTTLEESINTISAPTFKQPNKRKRI